MKRYVCSVLLIMGIVMLVVAVAATDFSGTYVRDNEKSDRMGMGRRGGEGGGPPPNMEVTLAIKQDANNFEVITQRGERTNEEKYTLDGKETTITTQRGSTVAKAKWNGNVLEIEGIRKFSGPNGDVERPFKTEYSLSADGKVLTVTQTTTRQGGEPRVNKQVYNKK